VSELPKSWVVTRLGDFAYVKNGFAFKSKHYVPTDTNTVPVIRISDIQNEKAVIDKASHVHKDNTQQDFLIVKDDLLIAMSGATTGKTGVYKSDVVAYQNQRVGNIKLHSKLLGSNTYKNYLIASLSEEILKKAYGAAQPNISGKSIEDILVAIAPLNEQTRIADKLDSMLAKVDAAQTRLDKIPNILKRFRQSVLAAATSGELTKEWRISNSQSAYDFELLRQNIYDNWLEARHAEFKRKGKTPKSTTWLKKFPEPNFIDSMIPTWISLSLENIAEVVDPNPSHRMPSYVVEGKPFISSENIININKLNFSKGKKVTAEEVEKQKTRYEIIEGTFAFTRIGTIGKSVLLPKPHDYGISHAMAVVNPYKSIMDSAFLILTMNCETILKQASHGVQSVGVPDLGIGKMKSFTVPLPPLIEQQEIVRRVESLFTMADTVEKQFLEAKARTNRLTQSILAKAFRGELVAQDSNDESAELLLRKIQQVYKTDVKSKKKK
jgi:type I restriction enzyme S subunit